MAHADQRTVEDRLIGIMMAANDFLQIVAQQPSRRYNFYSRTIFPVKLSIAMPSCSINSDNKIDIRGNITLWHDI